jgi:hypothetical protein
MLFLILGSSYPAMCCFIVLATPVAKAFDATCGRHHFDAYLSLLGVVNRTQLSVLAIQSLLMLNPLLPTIGWP